MDELKKRLEKLILDINNDTQKLQIDEKIHELEKIREQSRQPNFWNKPEAAELMKRESLLTNQTALWQVLLENAKKLRSVVDLGDASLEKEINDELSGLEKEYADNKKINRFSGPYDNRGVILNIYAGAGGTDAQDWAEMLQRMYTRWAEAHGAKVELMDLSRGDEAGIKSVTLKLLGGEFLYGKLAGEHGVHRLVRKSPFNSSGSRETSFARVDVLPVIDEPKEIELDDKDLKIDVFRSGGAGGQSVNTTDSAVRVTHLPTGITVSIQNERSQLQNKETALGILRSRLAQLQAQQHAASLSEIKGPTKAAEWGSQIRNYILDDRIVKDLRSGWETHNPESVLDGNLDPVIEAGLAKH